ncbi:MAG: hypothetical protein HZA35_00055 [Parcubacteria group bacterium]|nr:hypothetical protein [Parcubacteria group bacterium]
MAAVLSDNYGNFAWGWNYMFLDRIHTGNGIHAEQHAIMRASPRRLRGHGITLTVAGKRKENFLLSKPCSVCLALAIKHGIETIEYLTRDGSWETLKFSYNKKL